MPLGIIQIQTDALICYLANSKVLADTHYSSIMDLYSAEETLPLEVFHQGN
jgi:hypothetical protein